MNDLVTGKAQAHQVAFIVGTALGERFPMVNQHGGSVSSFTQTLFAQRVSLDVAVAYLLPCAVITLVAVIAAGELVVVAVHQLCVFLAVNSVR